MNSSEKQINGALQNMMEDMDKIPIFIPDEEAKKFLIFQEHYDIFVAMQAADAFSVGWGKVVLNFANYELQNVVREEVAWRREK